MLGLSRTALVSTSRNKKHALVFSRRVLSSSTKVAKVTHAPATLSQKITSFPKENPFLFQLLIATGKTSAADIMVQLVVENKKLSEIDWRRNGIFVAFGFAYLGGFQYWIMVNKYRQWFPTMDRFGKLSLAEKMKDTAGILDALKMVAFDVCVHLPFMYFPAYYTCKEFVTSDKRNPSLWVAEGCANYYNNMTEDLSAMIKLWGPSDCVQFILPTHIRMPFRHMVSFFWTAYVSFTRGGSDPDASEEEEAAKVVKIERKITVAGPE